jgi:hypothetical protein
MSEYKYECKTCGKKYSEHRTAQQPQWFKNCDVCSGEYEEVK